MITSQPALRVSANDRTAPARISRAVVVPDELPQVENRDVAVTYDDVTFVVDWAVGEEELDSTWLG